MTMQGKIDQMKMIEPETDAAETLALSICRRPIVAETVARVLGRMPAFSLRSAQESITALSAETEAGIGAAALVVFEIDPASLSDSNAILRLVELGGPKTRFLAVTGEWWAYDFPEPYAPTGHKLEVFRGQQQRWAAFRFLGRDEDIDLSATGDGFYPEFSEWRWARLEEAVAGVMPFKRPNYEKVAAAFARFARI